MDYPLWIAGVAVIAGLVPWHSLLWRFHKYAAAPLLCLELVLLLSMVISGRGFLSLLIASVSFYKFINYVRLYTNRMHDEFLRRVTLRAQIWLSIVQGAIIALAFSGYTVNFQSLFVAIAIVQLVLSCVIGASTLRHLRTTKTLQASTSYTDAQLPTLSVLVPARNETTDLDACLKSLVASDYPKLEIIVLDDCSQTKRTPEIIRAFAHDGVRFIAGKQADDSWLAKNYAYQQLAEAASGEYLLFCGVDVRMKPSAMRELITTMLEKNKSMLSVLPRNRYPSRFRSRLVQPMRYAWELSLPRRLFSRPPVLSTCWVINKEKFDSVGGFKATSRSILPESHFSRTAARGDGYSFVRSDMLVSDKSFVEQRATTIRMRYPQLRRRLELVWLFTTLELVCLVLPIIVAIALAFGEQPVLALIALSSALINWAVKIAVTGVMYGKPLWGNVADIALYDIYLLNYSMYRYEFRSVIWKDRNICLPVMRVDSGF